MIGDLQGEHQLHDLFEGVGNCMLLLLFLGGAQGLVGGGVWPKKERCEVTETWNAQYREQCYTTVTHLGLFLVKDEKKDNGRGVKGDVTKAIFSKR